MRGIGIADAARNNAAWCEAVCSAHGAPGELHDSHWLTRAPAPPLHPNLVTLESAPARVLAAVGELARARPSASWAVKDSFAALPLERDGFRPLLDAEWIVRAARPPPLHRRSRWRRLRSEPALAAWEAAWGESAGRSRIFSTALLHHDEIAILAALDDAGAITAGVVANRTGHLVGLTNVFVRGGESESLRAECIDAASDAFPGLPLVGYESGPALAEAHRLGFSSLGALRVWVA